MPPPKLVVAHVYPHTLLMTPDDIPDTSPWYGLLVTTPRAGHVYIQMTYTWSTADNEEHTDCAYFDFPPFVADIDPRTLARILTDTGELRACAKTAELYEPWAVAVETENEEAEVVYTYTPTRVCYAVKHDDT